MGQVHRYYRYISFIWSIATKHVVKQTIDIHSKAYRKGARSAMALTMGLGHVLFGSGLGVVLLVIYVGSYSLGAIWMMGAQQGLVVVSALVWCIILSAWLVPHPGVPSVLNMF
jgi:hypothetical protein